MSGEEKPATALRFAEALARGCAEAGWDVEPVFTMSEDGENSAEEPDGGEVRVYFAVNVGQPERSFTIEVTDDTLSNEIRQMNEL